MKTERTLALKRDELIGGERMKRNLQVCFRVLARIRALFAPERNGNSPSCVSMRLAPPKPNVKERKRGWQQSTRPGFTGNNRKHPLQKLIFMEMLTKSSQKNPSFYPLESKLQRGPGKSAAISVLQMQASRTITFPQPDAVIQSPAEVTGFITKP